MMDTAERDDRVMTLAAEALTRPRGERDSFLQVACQNDPILYREVSEVVTWEERMQSFLRRPLIEFIDLEGLENPFQPGETISARFEVLRCVGDGGMGVVYEAFDRKRQQRIAIKCAKPGFGRLLKPELEGALKVRHPNICMVNEIHTTSTDLGELDFLTMEFLDGETLASRLERGKLDEAEALAIARQLCAGLAEAHQSSILHRDLKPGNVILCPRKNGGTRAVITDFGLAAESSVTNELIGGTPDYMAPELARGEKASQASDAFSLGVILYEMVTGQKPFSHRAQGNGMISRPVVPSKLVKGLSHRWDAAIVPCLENEPQKRGSATKTLAALERKPIYRRPALVFALASCLALATVFKPMIVQYFTPLPIRLAILPAEGPGEMAQTSKGILDDVTQRIQRMQNGNPTALVVPLSEISRKGITTPQQAQKVLHATHVLQLKLRPQPGGMAAEGAVVDAATLAHVWDYSAHFAGSDLGDLPGGLAGSVTRALHLHRIAPPEALAPAARAAYRSGLEHLKREDDSKSEAFALFQTAAGLDPHSPLPLAGLAEAKVREFQARNDEHALQDADLWLAKAEALDPDSPRVLLASGLLNQVQGNHSKALESYLRVLEIDPGNVEALLGSGFSYETEQNMDKALTVYRQAAATTPQYYKPYEYLGAFYFYQGRYVEAEEWYRKDVELAPDRPDGYGSLGAAYVAQFKYADAEKAFRASAQLKESALTLNNIGAMLAYQHRDDEAIPYYFRAVQLAPSSYIYWLNLGDSQRRTKHSAQAKLAYKRGRKLASDQIAGNPASGSARGYLAYFEARLGAKAEAKQEIAAALKLAGGDNQVVLCAVQTYEVLGDRMHALQVTGKATDQTLKEIQNHPDLAELRDDSRFRLLMVQLK
ncbi:MAG: protein kinase [Candidatus Angelobacter sp.]